MSLCVCTSAPVGNDDSTIPLKSVAIICSVVLPLLFLSSIGIILVVLSESCTMRVPRMICFFSSFRFEDSALRTFLDTPLISRMILR